LGTVRLRHIVRDGSGAACVTFSPDGKQLASAGWRETTLCEVDSGKVLSSFRRLIPAWTMQSLAFSKDLGTLAAPNYKEIKLWDGGKGKPRALLSEHRGQVCRGACSPDGKTLIAASYLSEGRAGKYRGEVRLWDVATGRERAVFPDGLGQARSPALSPGGAVLALLDVPEPHTEADLKLVDVGTGRQRVIHHATGSSFLSPAFTTDGKLLVTGRSVDAVRLWEVSLQEGAEK